ncbi:MAG: hypothetical protein NUV34_05410 [Sulfuricaulis sp.]|nr:hypothetical protein [Sulfuricaulis sp.]
MHQLLRQVGQWVASHRFGLFNQIKQAGIATVIVDKNFAAVSAVADRVVILVKGTTVYDGASAELRAQPELHVKYLGV